MKEIAIVSVANAALFKADPDYNPYLFNQIYRCYNDSDDNICISLQDHNCNVTPFVRVSQKTIDKMIEVDAIAEYLIEENFPISHLKVLRGIIGHFNASKAAETEVLEFAERLKAADNG